jgi:hypothetical protein
MPALHFTVFLPKPMTSGINAKGRFGKQDFVYVAADDVHLCPAGEQLTYHYTDGMGHLFCIRLHFVREERIGIAQIARG